MINKRLLNLLPQSMKYIGGMVLFQWFHMLLNVILVFLLGTLFQKAATLSSVNNGLNVGTIPAGNSNIVTLGMQFLAAMVIVLILRAICLKINSSFSYKACKGVKNVLRTKIYEKLLRMGPSYSEKLSTSQVLQISMEGTEQLEVYFGKYMPQLFYSLLAPITLFIILGTVNLKAALVLLCCVPLIPLSIIAVQKFAKRLFNKYWGSYTELGDSFLENLQGLTTLKIYQADQRKTQEMDAEAENFRRITMRVLIMQLNSISVMDLIAYGGAAAGIIVALLEYRAGRMDFLGLFAFILLSAEFFIPLRMLGSFFHVAMNGMSASDKIFQFLELEENVKYNRDLSKGNHSIVLKHVIFQYEESRTILNGLNFEVPVHSFISLVGESGCGKSTVASLLTGKVTGYRGSIRIGDTELSDIYPESLQKHITLVAHDGYLFTGTIRDNLLMGKPKADDAMLFNILKQVNMYDFLMSEEGLDTVLAEQGMNLSGGQRQRLIFARALLRDTPVYIFDEATSNIDAESEEDIMRIIIRMAKTKTVILISHRLANVKQSDCIYMLKDGVIKEQGTHDELLGLNGEYGKLYLAQQHLENYGRGEGIYA